MKVASIQMVSTPDPQENLLHVTSLVNEAVQEGAELLVLPEYFCLMGHRDQDKLLIAERLGQGPIQDHLSTLAQTHQCWIVAGTLPLKIDGDDQHVTNTTLVFDPTGSIQARYDKMHLFRFDDGAQSYDESRVLKAGDQPGSFHMTDRSGVSWRIGLSVCYDLRFPEYFRALMHPPCDLIVVPAAFTAVTGQAHWDILLRARAVENQCFVIASAQGGAHANGRQTYGHSMLIDPWGKVMASLPEGPGVITGQLQKATLNQIRQQLPALQHRRLVER